MNHASGRPRGFSAVPVFTATGDGGLPAGADLDGAHRSPHDPRRRVFHYPAFVQPTIEGAAAEA